MKVKREKILTLTVLLLGCIFMGTGIYRGEYKTVEAKSNMICLECIGIG